MPHRQDFEAIPSDSVIDPIPDAIQVQPPHISRTRFVDAYPDVWLHKQKIQCGLQILTHSAWSRRPVYCPPLHNAFDLARSASRDEKLKRHSYR